MKRLIEKMVFSGFVTCCRRAGAPTSRWPSFVNATTDGVVRPPSAFGITVGSDIDFGTEIAKQMGVKAVFKNTVFDSIIAALKAKKCDAIISGMNDTPERRKQVDFVDYLKVGQ